MAESTKTPTVPQEARADAVFHHRHQIDQGRAVVAAGVGRLQLAGNDLSDLFDRFVQWVHLDPENRFLSDIGDWLDPITPANVRWLATGTFLYSLFLLVEGVGLMFRATWAIWLAIGESAFFIPIEIFELVRRHRTETLITRSPNFSAIPDRLVDRAGDQRVHRLVSFRKPETAVPAPPLNSRDGLRLMISPSIDKFP